MGTQARKTGTAECCIGARNVFDFSGFGQRVTHCSQYALHRHAGQRHPIATRAPARIGGRGSSSAQPAADQCRWAQRGERLWHPAAPRGHAFARPQGHHALPLAFCRAVRHRPLQCRELRGIPGSFWRRHLHRQGAVPRAGHACHFGKSAAGRPSAEPRFAGRVASTLRCSHRHHADRRRAVSFRCGCVPGSSLDPW